MTISRTSAGALALVALAACLDSGSGGGSGGLLGQRSPPGSRPPPVTSCINGQVETTACGSCGTQSRTCSGGTWGARTACAGERTCAGGAQESAACGSAVGTCRAEPSGSATTLRDGYGNP
jgi:hypothetical protein